MGYCFVHRAGIAIDQRHAVAIGKRRVIDLGVVANNRLQQAADRIIMLQNCGYGIASLDGILRIEMIAGQFGFQRLARYVQYLVSDEIGIVVALVDALAENLGNVETGERGNQGEDQSADCEHQLSF